MNKCNYCYLDKAGPFYLLNAALCCLSCYKRYFANFKGSDVKLT